MADHRQKPFFGPSPVDVSIPGAHWAQSRAEISSDRIKDIGAKSQSASGIADQWRENIALAEGVADRRAESFLAFAEKDAAVNLAGAIKGGKLFIQHPRQK